MTISDRVSTVQRALIITDRPPLVGADPGFERRFASIRTWIMEAGLEVDSMALSGSDGDRPGKFRRALVALFPPRRLRVALSEYDLVVVLALGAPHMTLFARHLQQVEAVVVLDLCDSLSLTMQASARRANKSSWIKAYASRSLLRITKGKVMISYISAQDAAADAQFARGRRSIVVEQCVPAGLEELDEFVGPARRIVIPADFAAPHNKVAMRWLVDGIREARISLRVPVDLFGPTAPNEKLPPGMLYRGWAPNLADVYRGDSAVFAPNIEAAGLQNKLWEAIHARRPVLIGAAAAGELAEQFGVLTFTDREDLYVKFDELQSFVANAEVSPQIDRSRSASVHELLSRD